MGKNLDKIRDTMAQMSANRTLLASLQPAGAQEAREEAEDRQMERAKSLLDIATKAQGGAGGENQPPIDLEAVLPQAEQIRPDNPGAAAAASVPASIQALTGGGGVQGQQTTTPVNRPGYTGTTTTTTTPRRGPYGIPMGTRESSVTVTQPDITAMNEEAGAITHGFDAMHKGEISTKQMFAILRSSKARLGDSPVRQQAVQKGLTDYRKIQMARPAVERKFALDLANYYAELGVTGEPVGQVVKAATRGTPQEVVRAVGRLPEMAPARRDRLAAQAEVTRINLNRSLLLNSELERQQTIAGIAARGVFGLHHPPPQQGDLTMNQAMTHLGQIMKEGKLSNTDWIRFGELQEFGLSRGKLWFYDDVTWRDDKTKNLDAQGPMEAWMTVHGHRLYDSKGNLVDSLERADLTQTNKAITKAVAALQGIGYQIANTGIDPNGEIIWDVGWDPDDPNSRLLARLYGVSQDHKNFESSRGRVYNDYSPGGPLVKYRAEAAPELPPEPEAKPKTTRPELTGRRSKAARAAAGAGPVSIPDVPGPALGATDATAREAREVGKMIGGEGEKLLQFLREQQGRHAEGGPLYRLIQERRKRPQR